MPDRTTTWVVLVHGGAKHIPPDLGPANREGCRAAAEAAAMILRYGGGAIPAAEAAIRSLEDNPLFNAGFGSVRNAEGEIEMDAALMDGATLDLGAVAAVRRLRNPIAAAAQMLREPPVLLVGEGAQQFAADHGITVDDRDPPTSPPCNAEKHGHDTVGCVVLDLHGHMAAATSTGGLAGTLAGRVGDSPLPGCGLYADDLVGAVALSGDGEAIMRTMVAARIIQALEAGADARSAAARIDAVERVGGEAGAVVVDRRGRIGVAHNSAHFALGIASDGIEPRGAIDRGEMEDLLDG